jgi:hypothetical protein
MCWWSSKHTKKNIVSHTFKAAISFELQHAIQNIGTRRFGSEFENVDPNEFYLQLQFPEKYVMFRLCAYGQSVLLLPLLSVVFILRLVLSLTRLSSLCFI